jgi:hypothetical protein
VPTFWIGLLKDKDLHQFFLLIAKVRLVPVMTSAVVTIVIVSPVSPMFAMMSAMVTVMVAVLYAPVVAIMVLRKQHTSGETAEKN